MALKADLRKKALQHRREVPQQEVNSLSQQIADLFFANYSPQAGEIVHTFLPIEQNHEINTWAVVERIWRDYPEVQVAVSVADAKDFSMTHFLLNADSELLKNKWGIPEPTTGIPIPESEITTVLVPLLAFDELGHRVGYGKGFYDRFLSLLPVASLKLGLALDPPVDRIDDVHDKDLILDAVITPNKVWSFAKEENEEEKEEASFDEENQDTDS